MQCKERKCSGICAYSAGNKHILSLSNPDILTFHCIYCWFVKTETHSRAVNVIAAWTKTVGNSDSGTCYRQSKHIAKKSDAFKYT